ncbi:hypothetical protein D9V86_11675 [Bacteroidetes/Chlorobi group bacterium ChocPot_Mid]|nr:MAG: hypothetical protein D9V86_11675 [Bacteroidetes/Chlorobi group bacterium ChocPot_Mid]
MKKSTYILTLTFFLTFALFYSSEATDYSVRVKRIAQDLYQINNSSIYVKTRYCHEYSYGDEAILSYTGHGYIKGKLYFGKNKQCYDIEEVYNGIKPEYGTVGISGNNIIQLDLILVPTIL